MDGVLRMYVQYIQYIHEVTRILIGKVQVQLCPAMVQKRSCTYTGKLHVHGICRPLAERRRRLLIFTLSHGVGPLEFGGAIIPLKPTGNTY